MEFNLGNNIIKLCIQGMDLEAKDKPEEANKIFLQASNEATNDFENLLQRILLLAHQKQFFPPGWVPTVLRPFDVSSL